MFRSGLLSALAAKMMVGEVEVKERPRPSPDYLMQLLNEKKLMTSLPNLCGIFTHLERLLDEGKWQSAASGETHWGKGKRDHVAVRSWHGFAGRPCRTTFEHTVDIVDRDRHGILLTYHGQCLAERTRTHGLASMRLFNPSSKQKMDVRVSWLTMVFHGVSCCTRDFLGDKRNFLSLT